MRSALLGVFGLAWETMPRFRCGWRDWKMLKKNGLSPEKGRTNAKLAVLTIDPSWVDRLKWISSQSTQTTPQNPG
jgi:hypothetical protein